MHLNRNLLCCIIFLITGIFLSVTYYSYPIHDFGNYYFGSRFALEGRDVTEIYEPYKFNLAVRNFPGMQQEKFLLNYAVVPPCTLFFYIPFTFWDIHLAKFLFNLTSLLVFCFFLFRLLKHLNIASIWILLLPVLVFIPFRNNLLFGQAYLLITGLMMGGFTAELKNKNLPAAILYSVAIVLKISPVILLIYLLIRKKMRLLLLTSLISLLIFLAAVSITGWDLMADYFFKSIPRMSQNEINNPYASTYQSFTVLLRNLFVPDQLLNPDAAFHAPLVFTIANGIFTGIIFFFLLSKLKILVNDFSAFALTLFSSLLLTSYTSSYSMVFLIPLCIHLIRIKPKSFALLLLLIFAVATIPVTVFQSQPLFFRFPRLYLLILLFFMIASGRELIASRFKWMLASIALFAGISILLLKKDHDGSTYFLSNEAGLLSYDFQIAGNNLLLKTLYEDGSRVREYVLTDSVRTVKPLAIINGQIDFNGPVTIDDDNKLNPMLINNNYILYLSDKNRGIGFYALRKLFVKQKSD